MKETFLLFMFFASTLVIALTIAFNTSSKYKTTLFILGMIFLLSIAAILLTQGVKKVNTDLSRILYNSRPKSAEEVYTLLFKKPVDSCVTVRNFKDQVIPKIDCCIWIELVLCPAELQRIINLKKYTETSMTKPDSLIFLKPFSDRPAWWTPQKLGDSIWKYHIIFKNGNEQNLFIGKDSMHVYLCDEAL